VLVTSNQEAASLPVIKEMLSVRYTRFDNQ
jgi:hypothetical protein